MFVRFTGILIALFLICGSCFTAFLPIGYAQELDKVEALTQQIQLKPNSAVCYFLRGFAFYERKQDELAVADYTKAIELQPQDAKLYYYRGYSYFQLEKNELAMADCNKAIALDPNNGDYYSERGYVAWKMNKMSQCIDAFTKALTFKPTAASYIGRGNGYGCMGKYKMAIGDFEKALQLDAQNSMAYFNLAQAYEGLGETQKSLANYQKAATSGLDLLPEVDQLKIKVRLDGNWTDFKEWR